MRTGCTAAAISRKHRALSIEGPAISQHCAWGLARQLQRRSITMSSTTPAELEDLLGDVNPFMIERILATQATTAEVAEALADAEDERRFGERRAPASPRVAEVREILEELLEDREEDDAATYAAPA